MTLTDQDRRLLTQANHHLPRATPEMRVIVSGLINLIDRLTAPPRVRCESCDASAEMDDLGNPPEGWGSHPYYCSDDEGGSLDACPDCIRRANRALAEAKAQGREDIEQVEGEIWEREHGQDGAA